MIARGEDETEAAEWTIEPVNDSAEQEKKKKKKKKKKEKKLKGNKEDKAEHREVIVETFSSLTIIITLILSLTLNLTLNTGLFVAVQ